MRRLLGLGLLAALAMALLALSAAPALGNHVHCGDTITQDTTLDGDLIDCPGDGIVIGADNITLDLNGHTIAGDGTPTQPYYCGEAGLVNGRVYSSSAPHGCEFVDGHDRVTVLDGTIRDFVQGAVFHAAPGSVLRDLTVTGGIGLSAEGISVSESSDVVIERNTVTSNGGIAMGISVYNNAGGAEINDNLVQGNGGSGIHATGEGFRIQRNVSLGNGEDGIHVHGSRSLVGRNYVSENTGDGIDVSDGADDNLVERNRVTRNGGNGIWIYEGARRNRIDNNWVSENAAGISQGYDAGIHISEGHDNTVEGNWVSGTRGDGIKLDEVNDRTTIVRNHVGRNSGSGIALRTSQYWEMHDNRIARNTMVANGLDGLSILEFAFDSSVERNFANGNDDDGIDVEGPQTLITRNHAAKNGDLGVEAVPGTIDGGGNAAFGNGNPLQCLNIACK